MAERRNREAGNGTGEPVKVRPAMIAGSIRAARRRAGVTLATLAARIDLDKGYLSRLERGEKNPSIGALLKIAEALNVQIGQLFGETTGKDAITVVRRDEHIDLAAAGDLLTQVILPAAGKRRLSAFLVEPDTSKGTRHAAHPGDELLYVLEGSVEVDFSDRSGQLEKGDCLHFDGHLRHLISSIDGQYSRVLIVVGQDLPR